MKVIIAGKGEVTLGAKDYVAEGGEAKVYAKGSTAFKVYHDPRKALPVGKIQELACISDPAVVRPVDPLVDVQGSALGYTMPFLPRTHALCQVFTRAFRDREGVDHATVLSLALRMRATTENVHQAGVLIVDGNEMNYLVSTGFDQVYFLDVDSWQTPSYPATALMESVRDRHMATPHGPFSEGTDWFSFAVVTFQLFTGIHPYKGKHPSVKDMDARMQANLSVFDPVVRVPPAAYPVTVIPPGWRAWYEAVFARGERGAPPLTAQAVAIPATPIVTAPVSSAKIVVTEMASFPGAIYAFTATPRGFAAVTAAGVIVDDRVAWNPAPGTPGIVTTPLRGTVVAAVAAPGGALVFQDTEHGVNIPFVSPVDAMMVCDNTLYVRCDDRLARVEWVESKDRVYAGLSLVANVHPYATRLFPGFALQVLLGATYATLLPAPGFSYAVRLPELERSRVVDAAFQRGVLVAVAERGGRLDRYVFRFVPGYTSYAVEVEPGVASAEVNLAVLDSGIAVLRDDDGDFLLFAADPAKTAKRLVPAATLPAMRLVADHGRLLAVAGPMLLQLRLT